MKNLLRILTCFIIRFSSLSSVQSFKFCATFALACFLFIGDLGFSKKAFSQMSSEDLQASSYLDNYFDSTFFKKWGATDVDAVIDIPRPSNLPPPAIPTPPVGWKTARISWVSTGRYLQYGQYYFHYTLSLTTDEGLSRSYDCSATGSGGGRGGGGGAMISYWDRNTALGPFSFTEYWYQIHQNSYLPNNFENLVETYSHSGISFSPCGFIENFVSNFSGIFANSSTSSMMFAYVYESRYFNGYMDFVYSDLKNMNSYRYGVIGDWSQLNYYYSGDPYSFDYNNGAGFWNPVYPFLPIEDFIYIIANGGLPAPNNNIKKD